MKLYQETVTNLITEANLLELVNKNEDYDRLKSSLVPLKTIQDLLSEDYLFHEYRAGLDASGTKPFKGFS